MLAFPTSNAARTRTPMPHPSVLRPIAGSILGLLGVLILARCTEAPAPEGLCASAGQCEGTATGGTAGIAAGGTSAGGSSSGGASGSMIIVTPLDAGPDSPEPADGDACAEVTFEVTNVVPSVVLLIDRSASMSEEALDALNPGVSRWDALKTALLDPPARLPRSRIRSVSASFSTRAARGRAPSARCSTKGESLRF